MLTVLSLGAGVQSTTMALMAAHGEITPMPDCAIFADTGAEPAAVYTHLAWLESGNVLPFPVEHVSRGSLKADILAASRGEAGNYGRAPFFVRNPDGSQGILTRQCTERYKLDPIEKKVRAMLGLKRGQRWPLKPAVEMWVGISTDEAHRMKPSGRPAVVRRYPLIEMRMARSDCLLWLERHGYPLPPKSACTFCPYRNDERWRHLRDTDAAGWAEAIEVDAALRTVGYRERVAEAYVHRSLVPLAEADIRSRADRVGQADMFGNECDGMCGV